MSDYSNRLRKSDWLVGDCDLSRARRMVTEHHYARGASNTRVACHGLYRASDYSLAGVAWWLPPTLTSAAKTWPDAPKQVLSLSRLVLTPGTPKNAATFLLSRSVRQISAHWVCLVTYADTWQGHTGHIYKAAGWEELGLTKPQPIYTIEGRQVATKCGPRTRTHAEMLAIGAVFVGRFPRWKFRLVRRPKAKVLPIQNHQRSLFDALEATSQGGAA